MNLGPLSNVWVRNVIVYAALIILVLFITKQYNIWGTKRGTTKTKVEVKKDKDNIKRRNSILVVLKFAESVCLHFGFVPNTAKVESFKFYIDRNKISVKYVDRNISPYELLGLFKIIKIVGCFLAVFLTVITGFAGFLLLFAVLFIDSIFKFVVEGLIADEDREIEDDFPDLYMLLYSRLARGTAVRISPTLDEYIKSIDAVDGEQSHKAIRNFVTTLRRYIEIYGDDSMAVHQMRNIYKSAMVVNFFNLAVQSLRGVDNREKLLAFKMELSQKRLQAMTAKAEAMVARGQRAIMLIYVILAQFVILSWAAKIGPQFMSFLS